MLLVPTRAAAHGHFSSRDTVRYEQPPQTGVKSMSLACACTVARLPPPASTESGPARPLNRRATGFPLPPDTAKSELLAGAAAAVVLRAHGPDSSPTRACLEAAATPLPAGCCIAAGSSSAASSGASASSASMSVPVPSCSSVSPNQGSGTPSSRPLLSSVAVGSAATDSRGCGLCGRQLVEGRKASPAVDAVAAASVGAARGGGEGLGGGVVAAGIAGCSGWPCPSSSLPAQSTQRGSGSVVGEKQDSVLLAAGSQHRAVVVAVAAAAAAHVAWLEL